MEQSINLAFVMKRRAAEDRPLTDALELCRQAGFFALDYITDVKTDDYLEKAKKAREEIDRQGLKVDQSHCPFFRYEPNGAQGELFRKFAPRAAEAAAILGARYLVIHADEYRVENRWDTREILDFTYEVLAPTVERCANLGIRPAFENLFEDGAWGTVNGRSRFCSLREEILQVIDLFPGSGAGCCWDFGHAQVAFGKDALAEFRAIQPQLLCTHVHDNSHAIDLHQPAFFGNFPWEDAITAMGDSGYSGDFSWEFVYERFPDGLLPKYLSFVHDIGEHLLSPLFQTH